jgi:hypothetical protein
MLERWFDGFFNMKVVQMYAIVDRIAGSLHAFAFVKARLAMCGTQCLLARNGLAGDGSQFSGGGRAKGGK